MQSNNLKKIIGETYNLEDHIIDRLEFTYIDKKLLTMIKLRYA